MTRTLTIAIGLLLVLVLVLFNTTYTVNFHELAVKTRFGQPAGVVRDPGLHLKAPFFIDQVTRLDTRLQFVESPLETVLTQGGEQVVLQAYLQWRIAAGDEAAMRFFTAYGTLEDAGRQLEQRLQGALRVVGRYPFDQLVGAGSKLADAERAILEDLKSGDLAGIEPVFVGISQVLLPPKTTNAVLGRMAEVQNTLAKLEEARGNSEAEALKSQAASQADAIRSFAEQWAAQIEAQGNEEATRYYEEMKKQADLAIFLAWLDTLKSGLSGSTTFITDTSRAPFHLLDLAAPTSASGIPQPPASEGPATKGEGR
jgi:membrane protease subunit HflC